MYFFIRFVLVILSYCFDNHLSLFFVSFLLLYASLNIVIIFPNLSALIQDDSTICQMTNSFNLTRISSLIHSCVTMA